MKFDKFKNTTYQTAADQEERVEAAGANIAATIEEKPKAEGIDAFMPEKKEIKDVRLNLLVKETTRKRLEAMKKKYKISINHFANTAILRALDEIEK